ncbi:MAG: ABC transporter ATP-binding protein [Ruminococcaceae bacterium]|nr:ABC transporter ATP-binding protein [Oscillospiraceae bacterium]
MKKLLVHMKGYKKQCVLAPLFKMLEACFELFIPLVVASIVDVGIKNNDTPYIVKCCLIMVALGAIGLTCTLFAQYFSAYAAVGFVSSIKHGLFKHISSLSYTEIDTLGTSTLITRMTSDINQVQSGVNLTLRLFMRSPVIVFGAMIMAFIVDVNASLVFVVAIPLLAVVVFGIILSTIPLYKKVQGKLDRVLNTSRENLSGVRVIRAFGLEESEKSKFHAQTEELNKAQVFVGKISAIMNPATYAIVNISISILIWRGAIQVNYGNLTQGQVIALYNYMSQILIELIKLANLIVTITKAVACANRIEGVLEVQPSQKSGSLTSGENNAYTVEFKKASLRYKNSPECTLEDISFTAMPGESIGIIGGTGSGKSSLINMIGRFYDCYEGQVLVEGNDVCDYDLEYLREQIGIVPQKAVLFKGTIRDNLKWGNKQATDTEILSAIDAAQATDVLNSKSEGLDFVIEEGGKNLSGGQRQRFTIARALVKKPKILILDDSCSALDYATDARLRHAIKNIDFNPTTFIVSQRTSSIMHCDKIIVLDDGKIVGMGKHEELLKSCLVYSEIYESQFKEEER